MEGTTKKRRISIDDEEMKSKKGKMMVCGVGGCGYMTDRSHNLQRHKTTMHGESVKTFSCCNMVFKNKGEFRLHTAKVHPEPKSYECTDCEKAFDRRALLARHMLVHKETKPYKCSDCTYNTGHWSNMVRHCHAKRHNLPDRKDCEDQKENIQVPSPGSIHNDENNICEDQKENIQAPPSPGNIRNDKNIVCEDQKENIQAPPCIKNLHYDHDPEGVDAFLCFLYDMAKKSEELVNN